MKGNLSRMASAQICDLTVVKTQARCLSAWYKEP